MFEDILSRQDTIGLQERDGRRLITKTAYA